MASNPLKNDALINALLAILSFGLLLGSYRFNELLDPFFLYAPGANLVFIPAGIKLLCLLVGGPAGVIGVLAASSYISIELWGSNTFLSTFLLACVSVATYYGAIKLVLLFGKVRRDLSNLNYWHIVVLSATASLMNGFALNFAYFTQSVTPESEVLNKGAAMAFGDFLGCCIVVMLFNAALHFFRAHPQR
jgi:hypothetical protein